MERVSVKLEENVQRLERAGFVAHRTAVELREVRERFPVRDDLAHRLQALEEEARTIAGLVAMEIRQLEDAEVYGSVAVARAS
jgi:uncharacterized protein YigA (DUF484 family)